MKVLKRTEMMILSFMHNKRWRENPGVTTVSIRAGEDFAQSQHFWLNVSLYTEGIFYTLFLNFSQKAYACKFHR